MKKILISLMMFLVVPAFAAIPSIEGLFRNINNKDIDGKIAVISFKIEEQEVKVSSETSESSEMAEDSVVSKKSKFVKIFLSIENPKRIEYMKIEYNGQGMSRSGVSKVTYYPNILQKMNQDKIIERELFLSMVNMFALNDSRGISQFLTRYNKDYFSNKSSLNEKKIVLFKQYKNYLEKINENKELKEELQSPFTNEDPKKDEEIKEILKESMYVRSDNVSLYREGNKYYWKVGLDSTKALFENNNFKLKQLEFNNGGGNIDLRVSEYILFDGVHALPKVVYFKDLMERIFKIRFLKYKTFLKLTKTIEERYKEMKEELVKSAAEKALNTTEKTTIENIEQEDLVPSSELFFY